MVALPLVLKLLLSDPPTSRFGTAAALLSVLVDCRGHYRNVCMERSS